MSQQNYKLASITSNTGGCLVTLIGSIFFGRCAIISG
jgi:hypothetical protein